MKKWNLGFFIFVYIFYFLEKLRKEERHLSLFCSLFIHFDKKYTFFPILYRYFEITFVLSRKKNLFFTLFFKKNTTTFFFFCYKFSVVNQVFFWLKNINSFFVFVFLSFTDTFSFIFLIFEKNLFFLIFWLSCKEKKKVIFAES